jgi:hypothetical protein
MNELKVIEQNNQRVLLTSQLAKSYRTDSNNIKNNFMNHKQRFDQGKHYFILQGDELKEFKNQVNNIDLVPKHTASLYLWTERGALRHAKILDTDKAWEVYEQLEDTYFKIQQIKMDTTNLSPELQMFNNLFKAIANAELSNKEIKQEIQDMRDVISLDTTSWRKDGHTLIVKAAQKLGGNQYIKELTTEVYKLIDARFGVNLNQRLTNKRRRMADEGICKSKRDKLNKMDIIAEDKKLIEGYVAITKELAIKYGAA